MTKTVGYLPFPRRAWRDAAVLALSCGLCAASPAAAEQLDLDSGWSFWLAKDAPTDSRPSPDWLAADPAGAEAVSVPHSWNLTRGADADGIGWYARTLVLPDGVAGKHL